MAVLNIDVHTEVVAWIDGIKLDSLTAFAKALNIELLEAAQSSLHPLPKK